MGRYSALSERKRTWKYRKWNEEASPRDRKPKAWSGCGLSEPWLPCAGSCRLVSFSLVSYVWKVPPSPLRAGNGELWEKRHVMARKAPATSFFSAMWHQQPWGTLTVAHSYADCPSKQEAQWTDDSFMTGLGRLGMLISLSCLAVWQFLPAPTDSVRY
jgi:hypothetical protein